MNTMGEEMHSMHSSCEDYLLSIGLRAKDDSPYTSHKVDKIRRHLRFHFMTPCEKYKARRRKPWKLIVQILKIVVVTIQVFSLGLQRYEFVDYQQKTNLALSHIMFKGWDPSWETMPYPATTGQYALYKTQDFFDHLNFAMTNFNTTEQDAIGAYGFTDTQRKQPHRSAVLKLKQFSTGRIFPHNFTYTLNPTLEDVDVNFEAVQLANGSWVYDIEQLLDKKNITMAINSLDQAELNVELNGIHIRDTNDLNPFNDPTCMMIAATVFYDNANHDGQMLVTMKIKLHHKECDEGSSFNSDDNKLEIGLTLLQDSVVILLCVVSFISCSRSVMKSIKLLQKSATFFEKHYDYHYKLEDKKLFVNLWFILIVLSDILCIIGTGIKIAITFHKLTLYDSASMLLGLSNLMIWMGVLRYFEYFKKYNILVLTIKKALPDVMQFLICAAIIYIAFTICGWLVLGPYHLKFATIMQSSECLFSLVNGDDMYVTFSVIDEKSPIGVYIFSRVYLYTFISIFIYFILNVFISVIIDTYEAVKDYYENGFPTTIVEKFMQSCVDEPDSPLYISDVGHRSSCCQSSPCCLLSCLRSGDDEDESRNLLT